MNINLKKLSNIKGRFLNNTDRVAKGVISFFKPRFKILAYHSIGLKSMDPFEVTYDNFIDQMNYLAKAGYKVVDLKDAFINMMNGNISEKTIVITFDDGFSTLTKYAFPVLKRYGFPATVFLPLKYIGGIDTFSYDKPRYDMSILTWNEIEKSEKYGIKYGSHTMSHRNLDDLDNQGLYYELNESTKILKQRFRSDFIALAYPFGLFSNRVKRFTYEAGYDCALCFGNIMSNTSFTDPFEMKREKILNSVSIEDFARIVEIKNDFSRKLKHTWTHYCPNV